ncbi:MAG TPA: Clp protease N-terminal domain-containing protein [Candidatus Dormibacteraeota bacterium]|nr:Clp protease N-terminal domain-containing protein [Candidatus Dormibacteraeota bacterium]
MATITPDPSQPTTTSGWTFKQISHDIPFTASGREVVELAQRIAGQKAAPHTEPLHLLGAIVLLPKNAAHRALVDLKVDVERLRGSADVGGVDPSRAAPPAPIGAAARYLLINAHREAQQLGHFRVDALHLLLALLYKDSPATAERLQAAGLSIYAIRQYLTAPGSAPKHARQRPLPSFDGALRISPVFAVPLGAMLIGGAGLWIGAPSDLIVPLSLLFVLGGWVTSLCIHEFGHALIAYLGGDRSVAAAGYLSLNPLKYTHPLLSIALPIVFLLIGGIGLPGGAVYLNEPAIRSDRWRSFASAAGPLANLLFAILIGWPFVLFAGQPPFGDPHLWAAVAFLVFLQITALVLNLIPIPPFDGFGIISPWLSIEWRVMANRLGMLPLLVLFFLLFYGGPFAAGFWSFVYGLTGVINVPPDLIVQGHHQFLPFR